MEDQQGRINESVCGSLSHHQQYLNQSNGWSKENRLDNHLQTCSECWPHLKADRFSQGRDAVSNSVTSAWLINLPSIIARRDQVEKEGLLFLLPRTVTGEQNNTGTAPTGRENTVPHPSFRHSHSRLFISLLDASTLISMQHRAAAPRDQAGRLVNKGATVTGHLSEAFSPVTDVSLSRPDSPS
ncbi:hypothetical protein EYF80_023163 [Liparis tanakae]|uniref:Uncharacterized protein n=1 Tax=Liparis tanakae TaxID=230148 RepID=A0A4Z2HL55_9TELE|nr:hypothetical protein EYF80_023163 [Liparis tanakae]